MTVTLDGTHGSGRDQRTDTSPTLGRRSLLPGRILNRALAVNRMACRRSLRDRNRGGLIFGPFRSPLREAKKFRSAAFRSAWACWSTTADTSLSHARSGGGLGRSQPRGQFGVRDIGEPSLMRFLPGGQPVVEHDARAPERPRQGLLLSWCRVEAVVIPEPHI
jgi:hypothetical protein